MRKTLKLAAVGHARLRDKPQLWSGRQDVVLRRITIEKLQTFQVFSIERVVDILRQVIADNFLGKRQARGPVGNDLRNVLQPVVARLLEYPREIYLSRH